MRKIILILTILVIGVSSGSAQKTKTNPYNLPITATMGQYQDECRKSSRNRMVDLQKTIPGIVPDIRYATTENFTGKKVYAFANAYLRQPAADSLAVIQKELLKMGLTLKIFDAYRPYAATLLFHEIVKDTLFAASPATGSRHNRGCSVDVSLVNLATKTELIMPTQYDDFTSRAGAFYADIPENAKSNRNLLIRVMEKHGFKVMPSEWWHFDFNGWQSYSLMDLSAEDLATK